MVLVTVRQEDAAEVAQPLQDVADVGNEQVDPALLFLGEFATRVEQDDVVAALDGRHVLADLADAAERDHPQRVIADRPDDGVAVLGGTVAVAGCSPLHALLVATGPAYAAIAISAATALLLLALRRALALTTAASAASSTAR